MELFMLFLVLLIPGTLCFIIPGVAPVEFSKGEPIEIKAVKMTSSLTQLPYEYYSLPFCKPKSGAIVYKSENLGEVLRGDRIVNTPYEIKMGVEQSCRVLCNDPKTPLIWSKEESVLVANRIQHQYYVHLLIDNLPCATRIIKFDGPQIPAQYEHGYRLGTVSKGHISINNHLKIRLKYHTQPGDNFRVVGFELELDSVDYDDMHFTGDVCNYLPSHKLQYIDVNGPTKVLFTYEVEWMESKIRWASRWDIYLALTDVHIHWFSTFNSLVVIFFLSGILTMILIRTVRRDIAKYNKNDDLESPIEESGWKLVHGDIFRTPNYPKLFVAVTGSGIQLFLMTSITIFFAMLGMLSPASRGALMTVAIFLYVFMGVFAGYFSGRLYKTLKGSQWKEVALLTAVLYPGIVFSCCFFLNFFIWGKQSSGAVPFTTMLALLCMWFGISLPLVYLGYYFGMRKPYKIPVRVNQIPRQIPEQHWYMNTFFSAMMAGLLPFGAMFIELFFILNAIWENQFYYLFGFLFLVFIILVICCCHISIVMIYFQLCCEDYNWWWRSIITSGGSSVYVLAYSVFYFFTKLDITEFIPTLLYFGYTAIMVVTFWVLTGTIGFYGAYFFVLYIYKAVKID